MRQVELSTSRIYEVLENSLEYRITLLCGGTRSSKTYNTLIWWIVKLLRENRKVLSIVRKTLPALKATAYRDFLEILQNLGLYEEKKHNKSEFTYTLNTNLVEFFAVDQGQKVRGRKRNYLFCNEINELRLEEWQQLVFRTSGKIVGDYNPSFLEHEFLDEVIKRKDCHHEISTYKDNPFLEPDIVREIEMLQYTNPNLWKIYGLGQRAVIEGLIYKNWSTYNAEPENVDYVYGLDFGYTAPMALVEVGIKDRQVYAKELFYKTSHTTGQLIEWMQANKISKTRPMYCDSAEKDRIIELRNAGYNAVQSIKDVKPGIVHMQSCELHIQEDSYNLQNELKTYQYKQDKDGKWLEEPMKAFDHSLDALRYSVYTHWMKYRDIKQRVHSGHQVHNTPYDTYRVGGFIY